MPLICPQATAAAAHPLVALSPHLHQRPWFSLHPRLILQVRVGDLLSHVLRHHRHSQYLGLALTWRPLYDMLLDLYDNPVPKLRGKQS
jgi:hypothetical protein